jgi:hypothetical protein
MVHAEMIQKINDHEITYQSEVNAPWPVENREMMMHLTVLLDEVNHQMQVETRNFESKLPSREDVIRVPFMHGVWKVAKIENDLQVEYTLRIDPGGSVPAWLVNFAMAEGPYVSFRNLKKELEKKKP